MALLPRPVTMMMFWTPECLASSTPYWIKGLSTRGSISFFMALVAGRNRVPRPAAGKTALRTFLVIQFLFYRLELTGSAGLLQKLGDGLQFLANFAEERGDLSRIRVEEIALYALALAGGCGGRDHFGFGARFE